MVSGPCLKSLSFTLVFQKVEVTVASLLNPPLPPTPPSASLGLSDREACTQHPSQQGLLPAAADRLFI